MLQRQRGAVHGRVALLIRQHFCGSPPCFSLSLSLALSLARSTRVFLLLRRSIQPGCPGRVGRSIGVGHAVRVGPAGDVGSSICVGRPVHVGSAILVLFAQVFTKTLRTLKKFGSAKTEEFGLQASTYASAHMKITSHRLCSWGSWSVLPSEGFGVCLESAWPRQRLRVSSPRVVVGPQI